MKGRVRKNEDADAEGTTYYADLVVRRRHAVQYHSVTVPFRQGHRPKLESYQVGEVTIFFEKSSSTTKQFSSQ